MPAAVKKPEEDLRQLALGTMERVLGREPAARILARLLDELGVQLRSADELMVLSQRMVRLGGFEGAVGAMLGVSAVMRGATPARLP